MILQAEDMVTGVLSTLILILSPLDIKYMIDNAIYVSKYCKYKSGQCNSKL